MIKKSTVAEIRARFDADVERFSRLETGQSATVDAPLTLELVAEACARTGVRARDLLDIGCGAGNFSLKIVQRLPTLNVTLVDLSGPMLTRAVERVRPQTSGSVTSIQADIRDLEVPSQSVDLIVAGAVLHHLRADEEWYAVFSKLHRALRAGGAFWICDLVEHSIGPIQEMMWDRYGEYLKNLNGEEYRDHVFAYIAQEDSPRPLPFQLQLLKEVGFSAIDVLHKNSCFALFGGIK